MNKSKKTSIYISDIKCANCAVTITEAIKKVNGITNVSVSVQNSTAYVEGNFNSEQVLASITQAGYLPKLSTAQRIKDRIEKRRIERLTEVKYWKQRSYFSIAAIPTIILSMSNMHGASNTNVILQAVFTTIGLLILAPPFYKKGLPDLIRLRFDMDSMVSLGTLLAYSVSLFELIRGGTHFYFEDSVAVLAFMTLGRFLEAKSKSRAADSIENLIDMIPSKTILLESGIEKEITTDLIKPGDIIVIKPGSKAPIDGKVIEGQAYADESILTGESTPQVKNPGSRIIAGSLIYDGRLIVESERTGEETSLGEILRELEKIGDKKTAYQLYADKVISIFMPVVLFFAASTFISWWFYSKNIFSAIKPTVAVLIIACPCAIGIAIPVAVSIGAAAAARRGILFRNPAVLDCITSIKTFIFDKTGCITFGKLSVREIITHNISVEEALQLTASAETASEHPIGKAVLDFYTGNNFHKLISFKAEPGAGTEADTGEWFIKTGRIDWLNLELNNEHSNWINKMQNQGYIIFGSYYKKRDKDAFALFALQDSIRPESPEVIAALKSLGIRTILLTGDNKRTADAIGTKIGIDSIISDVKPFEKKEKVREFKVKYGTTAMLGDGVNDAPAILEADIGIAMALGAGVTVEAGAVSLIRPDLRLTLDIIKIGRAIELKAKQNLFWAFAYNVILIPLAALGIASPMMAAIAMGLSDITVVLNAMMLWKLASK